MINEKPKFLYHGSPHREIDEFEPRISHGSGESHGALVYAADDMVAASIFMAKPHGYSKAGKLGEAWYFIIAEPREEFLAHDKGGHIYVLPSDTFKKHSPEKGFTEWEWASSIPVKPLRKLEYSSALDTILQNGVQVWFVDELIYEKLKPLHGSEQLPILRTIQSENQRRGVKKF